MKLLPLQVLVRVFSGASHTGASSDLGRLGPWGRESRPRAFQVIFLSHTFFLKRNRTLERGCETFRFLSAGMLTHFKEAFRPNQAHLCPDVVCGPPVVSGLDANLPLRSPDWMIVTMRIILVDFPNTLASPTLFISGGEIRKEFEIGKESQK